MGGSVAGIGRNAALFATINKDTAELHHELMPFDAATAQTAQGGLRNAHSQIACPR